MSKEYLSKLKNNAVKQLKDEGFFRDSLESAMHTDLVP